LRTTYRDVLALLDLAVDPGGHVGGDLDGASLDVEEPEAVSTAGRLEGVGLADQLDSVGGQPGGEGVDAGAVGCAEGDEIEPLLRGASNADHVLLR
jgi:hypothetical protein